MSGTGLYVGGLVGDNSGPVVAAYGRPVYRRELVGRQQAGGSAIGRNNWYGSITASYAIGSVTVAAAAIVGGLVGQWTPAER